MNNFKFLKDKDFSQGRRYIGASDVSTIALLNLKYGQTPLTLWEYLTGRKERPKAGIRAHMGHELEDLALKKGLEKLGYSKGYVTDFLITRLQNRVFFQELRSWTEFRCPDHPYIVCHPDLIDVNRNRNIEAKSHGFFGALRRDDINYGYDKDDDSVNAIPASIYLQIQTQALCIGNPESYVSALIDNIPHLYGPIAPHVKTQEKILAICERFWWHVENDKPPKPETWADVIALNPDLDKENKTVISGEQEEKVREMKERAKIIRARQKKDKAELDDIKNAMGLLIGKNAIMENAEGQGLATAFEVTKYFLKDYKKMSKQRFNRMIKDGFITESKYRDMRY